LPGGDYTPSMPALSLAVLLAAAGAAPDLRALVSRADLRYETPAARSEEGMPLGNGRMGTLVWSVPHALRFQINRVDVYPLGSATTSFFERHGDYCCGAAFLDVDLGGPVLAGPAFAQHLSLYDGAMSVGGEGVTVRLLAWHARDVMALEVEDRRPRPQPIGVSLRMLRFASPHSGSDHEKQVAERANVVRTFDHTATSRVWAQGETIALTQEFQEAAHWNASAVAARVVGRSARPQFPHESEVRLSVPAARGTFWILVGSASSFHPAQPVREEAEAVAAAAATAGYAALAEDNRRFWHAFWSQGFVDLRSADGTAQYVADNYHYFLYLMAASSRGAFPPKFNGMLWNTGGDLRAWGSQHWFANLSCYYEALFAANRLELLDPVFSMYGGAREAYAGAARQQWGSQGIFVPETTFFDGLAALPDDVAAEMRELYLIRKPWAERSARFREYARPRHPHSSRWNWNGSGRWVDGQWTFADRGAGPYGPVTHILGTTAKVAYLFWRRYEFTQDAAWLQERAYPMLEGAAEFYRSFPSLEKGPDGRYHIHHVNSNESVWGARDTDEDLSAMRGAFAAAIRASEILGKDPGPRAAWREVRDHLAPLPTSDEPDALKPAEYRGPRVFVRGRQPVVQGRGLRPDANSLPHWFFDLVSLEADDASLRETAQSTFGAYFNEPIGAQTNVGVLSKLAIAGALLGRPEAARFLVPNQMRSLRAERPAAYGQGRPLLNRLALREGHQALDAQRLGRAAEALQLALLQSQPPGPARDPVLRLFPAWPKEWDASFKLLARGGFVVSASVRGGRIEAVELESRAGARCRLRNPWSPARVLLRRARGAATTLEGELVEFPTEVGERLALSPAPER
jgi:hypothetical protein